MLVPKWTFCPKCGASTSPEQTDRTIAYESGEGIFALQPPVPWVIQKLYLASGRPYLFAGYGYSAKTISVQALLLGVASGFPVWGHFRVQRPGIVLHLDHEQGKRATKIRYQRLAHAMGIEPEAMWDNLRIACLPPNFRLSDPGAEKQLEEACQGVEVCSIDSLRASVIGIDENDSAIREHLDKLTRVSENTGTSFIVIHHAGKGGAQKDARETARGSSAIFDACGTVLRLVGEVEDDGSTQVQVSMTKTSADACGARQDAFFLIVDDVSDDTDPHWGLSCEYRNEEQINPPKSPAERNAELASEIVAFLRATPGATTRMIREGVGRNTSAVGAALDALELGGTVKHKAGPNKSHHYYLKGGSDE